MDRIIVYPFEVVDDTDLLNSERNTIIAVGNILDAMVGKGFVSNNLTCVQSPVPDLNINVSASMLTSNLTVDPVAYGSLGIDTDPLVKQGINTATTVIPLTAPATVGFSINYLIQAQVNEADTDVASRGFFNGTPPPSSNPVAQRRADTITYVAKAGTAAPTGTQATPAPDAGFCGCFVVTVDQGQTAIVNADIVRYTSTGAVAFLDNKLQDALTITQGDARYVLQSNSTNFKAVRLTNQTITTAVTTKILLNSTMFNTNSGFNTTTSRFQPTIPGYYSIMGSANIDFVGSTSESVINLFIYKNGAEYSAANNQYLAGQAICQVADTVYLNGSTDYVEFYVMTASDLSNAPLLASNQSTYLTGFKTP